MRFERSWMSGLLTANVRKQFTAWEELDGRFRVVKEYGDVRFLGVPSSHVETGKYSGLHGAFRGREA